MKKLLIVYYSWSNGNTEQIAKALQAVTGGELAKLETVTPYSGSYDDVVVQGQEEVGRGYQPDIRPLEVCAADYDVIALGTPTWWYTMAPAMLTFLNSRSWNGKTIVPFQTDGGWPGHTLKDIKDACEGAKVACEFEVRFDSQGGDRMETPKAEITAWANAVKILLKE